MSSTIVMPSTRSEDLSFMRFSSSNTLTVTTVLVIERARARNSESKNEKPRVWAVKNTIIRVPSASDSATTSDTLPIDLSFAIGNSVPTPKRSIMIPSSAIRFMVSMLLTRLKGRVYGPIIMPARM